MDIDFNNLLTAVVIAVLPVLTGFLCDLIHKAAAHFAEKAKEEREKAFLEQIGTTVANAVAYVNQTFVDELKEAGTFGESEEYASAAFEQAYEATIETLAPKITEWIEETYGALKPFLTVQIEKAVKAAKEW